MKSSAICWFSIPAIALITIGSGCGKSAQEQAFDTEAQPEQVQVEIVVKDKRAIKSVEQAPQMPSGTNMGTQWPQQSSPQWGQAGNQQTRYGASASGGPGYGNGYGGRPGYGGGSSMGLGGPGVGGSLAGDPTKAWAGGFNGAANGAPAMAGGPGGGFGGGPGGVGGFGGGAGGFGGGAGGFPGGAGGFGGFGGGIPGSPIPLGDYGALGNGGPGFAGPGVPFGPGPYGVFEPALMPYQPFVVEDVVGWDDEDWGEDNCNENNDGQRRRGCKKDRKGKRSRTQGNLKATHTGHLLQQ